MLLTAAAAVLWGTAAFALTRRRRSEAQVLAVAAAGATTAAVSSAQLGRQGDRCRDLVLSAVDLYRETTPACRYPGSVQRLRPAAPA